MRPAREPAGVGEGVGAVLVAAGRSTRMGFDKLWAPLGDRPVLAWTFGGLLSAGLGVFGRVVLVVSRERMAEAEALVGASAERANIATVVVEGGERRRDSVAAGVKALGDCSWIVVHDAARPFISRYMVADGLATARETGAAVAVLPSRDTIKRLRESVVVETLLPRDELFLVQTPQVFRRDVLREALASTGEDATDEATLVERLGGRVRGFLGSATNFKITTPEDLELARAVVDLRRGRGR